MADCVFSSSWVTEGDGIHMLHECTEHPEFRWYSGTWPSTEDLMAKMEHHRFLLDYQEATEIQEQMRISGSTREDWKALGTLAEWVDQKEPGSSGEDQKA